mmetsp:Transcript_2965/g.4095  ORF Transcript_2965/g.4095 Transcript_2965/m.4095 type:complete len:470 (-) Transcript_2965:54-1463(-)
MSNTFGQVILGRKQSRKYSRENRGTGSVNSSSDGNYNDSGLFNKSNVMSSLFGRAAAFNPTTNRGYSDVPNLSPYGSIHNGNDESKDNTSISSKNAEKVRFESDEEANDSIMENLIEIVFTKTVSPLLLAMPFAYASYHMEWGPVWVFWLNFLAMIPLASILGDFTEELAMHTNQTIGGLINATFGNVVEVVVAIIALNAGEIRVVQASMIGSIFSNLLLVLGCCFFFGGINRKEQTFNATSTSANISLLALSSLALVLPTPFAAYYEIEDEHVLSVSRIAAIFLISMYVQLLIFQLKTHAHCFDGEDEEEPAIPFFVALVGLLSMTLLVTIFSDYLVDSIDGFTEESGISKTFVGLIVLPIVGNAVEHITAVTVAVKDKMDLALGIAIGSSVQIALFVVPVIVLYGWFADKDMTLNFPHFELTVYVMSIIIVALCCMDGSSNWLEGSLLVTTYLMIGVGFWYEEVRSF